MPARRCKVRVKLFGSLHRGQETPCSLLLRPKRALFPGSSLWTNPHGSQLRKELRPPPASHLDQVGLQSCRSILPATRKFVNWAKAECFSCLREAKARAPAAGGPRSRIACQSLPARSYQDAETSLAR